jgi:phosphoribosylamine-glycine ligase
MGANVAQAKEKAYEAVGKIKFEQACYRTDIADKAIKKGN